MTSAELVASVADYYLSSRDFNGLPASSLLSKSKLTGDEFRELLRSLIESRKITAVFGDNHPNPHIRAFADSDPQEQIAKLEKASDHSFVLYPTREMLAERVDTTVYADRPYTRELALGSGQLEYRVFDLAVLDHYRRDPRYALWSNDIHVTLSITDEAYSSAAFPEKHKILIQHFGYCYSESGRRAVAVFLGDLSGLTPEHQQLWVTHSIDGHHRLHPDYYDSAISGDWGTGISLRDAFAEELKAINSMCAAIGWPPLFRSAPDELPTELAFILRPTQAAFNEFVLTLDKLLSENINSAFFPDSIPRQSEIDRADGKIEVRNVGSIALLETWLAKSFRTPDPTPLKEAVATIREIRKLRQKPAHAVESDGYDETLFQKQRDLFKRAYMALKILRLILEKHPKAAPVLSTIHERVIRGDIWTR